MISGSERNAERSVFKRSRRQFLADMASVACLGAGLHGSYAFAEDSAAMMKDIEAIDLAGIVDAHVHGNTRRKGYGKDLTAYETALAMAEHEIKAWVDKDKRGYTWSTAELLRRAVPGTITLGSLVLDREVGGINPQAVLTATAGNRVYAGGDARVIWMTSESSQIDKYVFITDSAGRLLPEVLQVLEIIAANKVALATGHLPYKHLLVLLPEAKRLHVEKIMITHSDWLTLEEQKTLCQYGVVFDRCIGTWPWWEKADFQKLKDDPLLFRSLVKPLVEIMRTVGLDNNIITTDWGPHTFWDHPPAAMKPYIWALMENGITAGEIDRLARTIPSGLVGV